MKKDFTYLALLVDRSGSMRSIREDAEGGLKNFIAEQRVLPGELAVALYQFDSIYEKVDDIDGWTLQPRGTTALLDSAGRAITDVGKTLSAMVEDDRPDRVVFVIITDGLENTSREWTRQQVLEIVKRQEDVYNWRFVFLGANIDAAGEAGSIGIGSAMNYDATGVGVRHASTLLSHSVSSYRLGTTSSVEVPLDAGSAT